MGSDGNSWDYFYHAVVQASCMTQDYQLNLSIWGSINMVSVSVDNPPPSYPGRAELNFPLLPRNTQPIVYMRITNRSRWTSCLMLAGRVTLAARRDKFSSRKHLSSPIWNNSWRGGCHVMLKINSAKPSVIEWPRKTQRMRDVKGYEWLCKIDFDSAYNDNVFTYKRSITFPQGEDCPEYPRPHKWSLSICQ